MTTPPVAVERRITQRFAFNLPVSLKDVSTSVEGLGFTQDLSSRGVFFFTEMTLTPGALIELTLKMPSEITLGDSMRVRCKGRVSRVVRPLGNGSMAPQEARPSEVQSMGEESATTHSKSAETKIGVAVCLSGYEYLAEIEDQSPDFRRVSALHGEDQHADEPANAPVRTSAC
jgi:hypothetical protein